MASLCSLWKRPSSFSTSYKVSLGWPLPTSAASPYPTLPFIPWAPAILFFCMFLKCAFSHHRTFVYANPTAWSFYITWIILIHPSDLWATQHHLPGWVMLPLFSTQRTGFLLFWVFICVIIIRLASVFSTRI